jgi:hypothetical protein
VVCWKPRPTLRSRLASRWRRSGASSPRTLIGEGVCLLRGSCWPVTPKVSRSNYRRRYIASWSRSWRRWRQARRSRSRRRSRSLRDALAYRERRRQRQYAMLAATAVDIDDEDDHNEMIERIRQARAAVAEQRRR